MPLIDLGSPFSSDGLAQLAGPFGSYLGGGTFPRSYEFAKRFVASESAYGSGTNGVTSMDDPTYLGFTLMFDIKSPLFNGATSGNTGIPATVPTNPSTVTGDTATEGLTTNLEAPPSGGSSNPSEPSAVAYLEKIGETNRANYLKAFIQGIQEVNQTRPYYFQTIVGLEDAWKKSSSFDIDPYQGTVPGEGIIIGCLEALDLKMTALFNLYKMAVYDNMYKRFVLPKNLMRFDVYVYVQEIRKFQTVRNWLGAGIGALNTQAKNDFINENTSQVGFRFRECEWDAAACGKLFGGVTNAGADIASTEIKFSYAVMENTSQFSGYDSKLDESKLQRSTDPGFLGKLKQFGKDQVMGQVEGAINLAGRAGASIISGFTFGNVFGARNDLLSSISNPQALANAALGAAIPGTLSDVGSRNTTQKIGDTLFAEVAPVGTDLESTQNFDPATPVGIGLQSMQNFDPAVPVGTGLQSTDLFPPVPPVGTGLQSTDLFPPVPPVGTGLQSTPAFLPSGPIPSTLSGNENVFD